MEPNQKISFDDTSIAFSSKNDAALKREYRLFRLMNNGNLVRIGTRLATLALRMHLPVRGLIRKTIYQQFCGGETIRQTGKVLEALHHSGVHAILDYGVEGKENEEDFQRTTDQLIQTIRFAGTQPNAPFISCKVTGITRFDLLEKLSAQQPLSTTDQADRDKLFERMHQIASTAKDAGIGLYIDAEETWIQDAIDQLTFELMRTYNKDRAVVYATPQMYRHDRLNWCKKAYEDAVTNNYILGLKPVRGAYMDKERRRAAELGYPSPIQPDKVSTDRDYDAVLAFALDHLDKVAVCAATHNEKSSMFLATEAIKRGIEPGNSHIHFSQLYGMSDHITFNLAKAGFNASKYLPYGPVKDVIPYLIRRAQENTSVAGSMSRELSLINKEIKRRGL
ncbi:MAG: proline dehydrogenase family protein [Chitinophagales bacterium]|nr:proline dehydrogenase family protein [Chitinophagales bacterium]HPR29871.1 proline dehydrogenase family protein [Chitinophagales bacterium]HQU39122.1 proline dehydrogenase family protein [Chitinophagales bacterium]HQU75246.1 proline dehydrogenase family protein [Chitinophagales bacterium]HRX24432.1 proline dehydrogenase family protein [Chitinophagales bacterium]